jgi:hypothetical protein
MRLIDADALPQLFTHLDTVDVPGMGRCWRVDDVLSAVCAAPTLVSADEDAQARLAAIRSIASPCARTQNGHANPRCMMDILKIIDGTKEA